MKLAWQQIPSTVISDLLCQNKLDGVVLDAEHGCFNNEMIYNCIQLITAYGKKCFVRPKGELIIWKKFHFMILIIT